MMNKVKILALDISTKTGWSLSEVSGNNHLLICTGVLTKRSEPKMYYPKSYLNWATDCAQDIEDLIDAHKPDELVIEETSKGSKNGLSQKILEFIHCFMAMYIVKYKITATYYKTEEWRRICGCLMTKEEKKQNVKIRKERKKGTVVVKGDDGKRIGKIGKKHVNVRRANELFNLELKLKDEDEADAILLGYAHFLNKYKENTL